MKRSSVDKMEFKDVKFKINVCIDISNKNSLKYLKVNNACPYNIHCKFLMIYCIFQGICR